MHFPAILAFLFLWTWCARHTCKLLCLHMCCMCTFLRVRSMCMCTCRTLATFHAAGGMAAGQLGVSCSGLRIIFLRKRCIQLWFDSWVHEKGSCSVCCTSFTQLMLFPVIVNILQKKQSQICHSVIKKLHTSGKTCQKAAIFFQYLNIWFLVFPFLSFLFGLGFSRFRR